MLINRKFNIIEVLTGVAKSAVKEKVSRMVIATFRVSPTLLLPMSSSVNNGTSTEYHRTFSPSPQPSPFHHSSQTTPSSSATRSKRANGQTRTSLKTWTISCPS